MTLSDRSLVLPPHCGRRCSTAIRIATPAEGLHRGRIPAREGSCRSRCRQKHKADIMEDVHAAGRQATAKPNAEEEEGLGVVHENFEGLVPSLASEAEIRSAFEKARSEERRVGKESRIRWSWY